MRYQDWTAYTQVLGEINLMKKIFSFLIISILTILSVTNASAAVTTYVSNEVGGNNQIARDAADLLDDNWMSDVNSMYQCNSTNNTNVARAAVTDPLNVTNIVNANGISVSINLQNVDSNMGTVNGNNFSAETSTTTLQSNAPMPTSMASGGYYANETGGSNASRNGALFKFSSPVRAFGAWFGDLETRTPNQYGSVRAYVRYFDSTMTQIGADYEITNTIDESQCGSLNTSNEFVGCGNATTRWIGFKSEESTPVQYMLVVVGDDDTIDPSNPLKVANIDTTNGNTESISFVGPTLVTANNCVPTSSYSSTMTSLTSGQTSLSSQTASGLSSISSTVSNTSELSSLGSAISSAFSNSAVCSQHSSLSHSSVTSTLTSSNSSNTSMNSSSSSCNCSPSFDTNICWNKVMTTTGGGQYFWGNSCKGDKLTCGQVCTQNLVALASSEVMQYLAWQSAGMPTIQGCEVPVCNNSSSLPSSTSISSSSSLSSQSSISSSLTSISSITSSLMSSSSITTSVANSTSSNMSSVNSVSSLPIGPSCGGVSNDMSVTKTHNGEFMKGQNVTFSIKVKNNGSYAATAPITVTDVLPVGMQFVNAHDIQNSGFICGTQGQIVTCIRNSDMYLGEEVTIDLTALVRSDAVCGPMSNFVTVMCGCRDSNPNNNTAVDNGVLSCPINSSSANTISSASVTSTVTSTPLPTGNVCQKVFWDNNNNAVYDSGDMPIPNVNVNLTLPNGSVISTVTNGNGDYCQSVPFGSIVSIVDYNDTDIRGVCNSVMNTTTNLVQVMTMSASGTKYFGNVGFYKACMSSSSKMSSTPTSVSSNMTSLPMATTSQTVSVVSSSASLLSSVQSSSQSGSVLGVATAATSNTVASSSKTSASTSGGSVLGLATTGNSYMQFFGISMIALISFVGLNKYFRRKRVY